MQIAIIGPGKMGTMIAGRLIETEFCEAESVHLSRVRDDKKQGVGERFPGVALLDDNALAVQGADIVFLCVRPESFKQVACDISGKINSNTLVISVMTGISTEAMQSQLGCKQIIRTSTNIGIQLGVATTYWTPTAETNERSIELATQLFNSWGDEIRCHEELWLDIAIAGVGSGPALVIEFLTALTRAMVTEGMPNDLAQKGVLSLVAGTTALCQSLNGGAMEDLQRMVTTPGGITAEARLVLDEGTFNATVIKAFRAACQKAKQLG